MGDRAWGTHQRVPAEWLEEWPELIGPVVTLAIEQARGQAMALGIGDPKLMVGFTVEFVEIGEST